MERTTCWPAPRASGALRVRARASTAGATGPLGLSRAEDASEDGAVPLLPRDLALLTLDQLPYELHKFGRLEGLGEEGVDADIEPALDLVLRTGADDGEGKITSPGIGTQPRGGPQPIEPRHHDIEGHDIGPHLMDDIQTLGTIGRGHDLDALQLEIDPDQLPDDLVVVHNKHPTRRAWHTSRVGPDRPPRPGFTYFCPAWGTEAEITGRDTSRDTSRDKPLQAACNARKPVHEHPEGAGSVLSVAASNATDTPP
jgi:hypothetical protein